MNFIFKILIGLFLLWLLAALLLYIFQRKLVYGPDQTHITPAQVGLDHMVEEITLKSPNGKTHYHWYGKAKAGKPTLFFTHGNGGNVAYREEKFRQLMAKGYGVYMVGYPGFGGSHGSPSEQTLIKASLAAYDDLTSRGIPKDKIIFYGESLGSSVAVQVASQRAGAAMILEAPMLSVLSIGQERYPVMPVKYFLKDQYLTDQYIKKVKLPLMIIHGSHDGIIPVNSGRALYKLANEPKEFHEIKGAAHNNLYEFGVIDLIEQFINKYIQK